MPSGVAISTSSPARRRWAQIEPDEPVLGLGPPGAVGGRGGVQRAGEPPQEVAELERVKATELIEPQRRRRR